MYYRLTDFLTQSVNLTSFQTLNKLWHKQFSSSWDAMTKGQVKNKKDTLLL